MSQLVAFTFGSFGDIFTILNLAWSISQLLSDASGASAQCQQLVTYLAIFARTLEIVKTLVVDPSLHSGSAAGSDAAPLSKPEFRPALNAISHALSICHPLMESFKSKLTSYETSLLSGKSKNLLGVIWHKFTWVSIENEALALCRNLDAQLQIINVILSAVFLHMDAHITVPREIPRSLPSGVWLTDMLNQTFVVPTEWCRSPADFHKYLLFYFKEQKRKGGIFIIRRRYLLEADGCNEPISPDDWSTRARPGEHILMNAVIDREFDVDPRVCPCCKTKNHIDVVEMIGGISCCSCGTMFKMSDAAAADDHEFLSASIFDQSSESHSQTDFVPEVCGEDLSFIRRVSLSLSFREAYRDAAFVNPVHASNINNPTVIASRPTDFELPPNTAEILREADAKSAVYLAHLRLLVKLVAREKRPVYSHAFRQRSRQGQRRVLND